MAEDDFLGLDSMLQAVGGVVNLTIEEREEINGAGAEVIQTALAKVTKEKHYHDHKTGSVKHLSDSVEVGQLEGSIQDGSRAIGYSTKDANHARIARFLNDGTKKLKGDSYIDETVAHNAEKAQQAQIDKMQDVLDRKEAGK